MEPGYYLDIPNADYHAGPGVSKSMLDLVRKSPALLEWSKKAPRDDQTVAAVDLGDAAHAVILEPHRFRQEYVVSPGFNLRTNAGKAQFREFREQAEGRKMLSYEQGRQLDLMWKSAMAHPYVRKLLSMRGDIEPSLYWRDPRTGLLCRCRTDKLIRAGNTILDVKTTGDMDRFHWSVQDFRYYVQDAFYSWGHEMVFGEPPAAFVFLVISTAKEMARYPVRTFMIPPDYRAQGAEEYREDLDAYAECLATGIWPGIETMNPPPRGKFK